MNYFWYSYAFVLGSVIGSFLNVCIFRLPKKESVVTGRSHCTSCGHVLSLLEMVPIFSYLFLRGKCKNCGCRISPRYPLIEFFTAACFLLCVMQYGFSADALLLCLFFCVLIVTAGIDCDTMEIPDILHIWILFFAIARFSLGYTSLRQSLVGFLIVSVPMLLITFITDGFGGGDIKLSAVCGLFMGARLILPGFLLGCCFAAAFGILLILQKKAVLSTNVPFGPFLAVGFILSALYGNDFIQWYFSFF